jgi:hypothetical protein
MLKTSGPQNEECDKTLGLHKMQNLKGFATGKSLLL